MQIFFFVLAAIFMAATLGTLFVGIGAMSKGGEFGKRHSNRLMRLRVLMQGLAIVCLMLGFFVGR